MAKDVDSLTLSELRQKYTLENSKFITLDGIDVHYVDQSQGEPIILLHASFLNLRAWNNIVPSLTKANRVIRFDFLGAGLTGSDPQQQESIERNLDILEELINELGLKQVTLVGTSSGAIPAFRYAAMYPEKVTRLILINAAGLPRTASTNPNRPNPALTQYDDTLLKPRSYYQTFFDLLFAPRVSTPDWLVSMSYDINRREGIVFEQERFAKSFQTGNPQDILKKISAPTLILWGKSNGVLSHLEADVFQHWMTGAPTLVQKLDRLGHYPYIENPELVGDTIMRFINGEFDHELRRTTMTPVLPYDNKGE